MRGRKLQYSGRRDTRPMKQRVREAIFNLVGPGIKGLHAIDLFAGTGAIGLEALSRGAASATLVECHIPTARLIQQNVDHLAVADRTTVVTGNAFVWLRQQPALPTIPWAVFLSPPYDFFVEREAEMLDTVQRFLELVPTGSMLVVEADRRFDFEQLPHRDRWDVRSYPPAMVGILRAGDALRCG